MPGRCLIKTKCLLVFTDTVVIHRAIHRDNSPHQWAILLTTERNQSSDAFGGAFYFSEYGVRVAGAPNTLIAWKQQQYHGTSLQDIDPLDPKPIFSQRGLAIVTSSRLLNTYIAWKKGEITTRDARDRIINGSGDPDIIYSEDS